MTQAYRAPSLTVGDTAVDQVETEFLVAPVPGAALETVTDLDQATGGALTRAHASGELGPSSGDRVLATVATAGWRARRILFVRVAEGDDPPQAQLTEAVAACAMEVRQRRSAELGLVLRGAHATTEMSRAAIAGLAQGGFEDRRYKTRVSGRRPPRPALEACQVVTSTDALERVRQGVHEGEVLGVSTNRARELANEPANRLRPVEFAERAAALAREGGVQVEVLDEQEIERLGMGLLLGVARGSVEPPRLLVLRHEPADAPSAPVLGLVGKGVTFDTGGISLKPPDGMPAMKRDMAGGAAVVGAMRAIGLLQVPVRCVAVVPMTENMPGGRATKPGDVLTSADGTTVEVLNTDAEGRLILADALWYARQQGATHLVDVATLTGSVVVALGHVSSGLFGQPADWVQAVQAAAGGAGERVWHLPLHEDFRDQLKSETADLANIGGRPGGACTAASFLQAFVGETPWAHLDIAGTAWVDRPAASRSRGATGVMVRSLTELARRTAAAGSAG